MAQVRKLQKGDSIPKAENKYKYVLDNQEIYLTDDDLKEINNRIANLPSKYKRFLGNATEAIKSGEESGNRVDNTVTMSQLSGLNKVNERRVEKQKPSTIESLFHTDSYDAKEAINEYLNIINSVVNTKPSKKKLDSSSITLDFNEDESGKKYLSATAGENISARDRISKVLEQLNAGDDSEYDLSDYDSIRSWMNGLGSEDNYKAATDYLTDLWTRMGAAGYAYNPDDEDFLRNFGIIYGLSKPVSEIVSTTSVTPAASTPTVTTENASSDITQITNNSESSTSGDTVAADDNDNVEVKSQIVIPTEDQSKIIVQSLPTPAGEKKTVKVRKLPYIASGVRGYEGKNGELTAEHIGNFSTGTMSYKIFRDDNGNYTFVSGIGNYPYDRVGREPITEELVQQILSGNVPEDLEKNLHYSENQLPDWLYNLPKNLLNTIQLSTPIGRMFAKRPYDPIAVLTEKQGGIIKADRGLRFNPQLSFEDHNWQHNYNVPSDSVVDQNRENRVDNINTNLNQTIGGGFVRNLPDHSKYLLPALSLARFGLTSHFQNKYYNQAKAALEAGRYEEIPTTLNTPDSSNPALDRALRQNYLMRAAGIKPVTSDWVQHNVLSNQRESQLWDREQSLLSQRSQYDHDIKNEILNIENQNLANRIKTANENAAKRAAIDSAIKQQALELTQRRGQSWDNLGLEIQNNLNQDRRTMLNYNYALESQRLNKQYDARLDELFRGARAKYNTLSEEEADEYYDFEDYLKRNPDYSDIYNENRNTIAGWQEDRANSLRKWMYDNSLNYSYGPWLTGRVSPIGIDRRKNGGVIKSEDGTKLKLKYPWKQNKRIETRPDGSVVGIIEEMDNLGTITTSEILLQEPTKTNSQNASENSTKKVPTKTSNSNTTTGVLYKPSYLQTVPFVSSNFEPIAFANWNDNLNKKSILPEGVILKEHLPIMYNQNKDMTDLVNVLQQLTSGYKKGGTLRGNTRYKNEPDEQIWIDNNKATHQAIAKLSENTIKLLLRALK